MKLHKSRSKVSFDSLIDFSFSMYICFSLVTRVCRSILSLIGLDTFGSIIGIALIYVPLIIVFIANPKRIPYDAIVIFAFILVYFALTLAFHPEYEFYYKRDTYGVWDYVLRPDNGIYAYLFLRLQKDPKRVLHILKIVSYIMLLYSLYRLIGAVRQGYWVIVNLDGSVSKMSYNLSFGYDTLFFTLVMAYTALEYRKIVDWVFAVGGVLIILVGGSRGPILDLGIFFVIYLLIKMQNSRQKIILIFWIVLAGTVLFLSYDAILTWTLGVLSKFGLESRFIRRFLAGSLSDTSTRGPIWKAAINMIREWPFGYGAMGTRHVIANYIDVGHPHNIFLEILVDTGVILGTIIIFRMIYRSVQIFLLKGIPEWVGLFLIFFSASCQLLVSGTLWHRMAIWAAFGISINIALYQKRRQLPNGRQQNQ